MSLAASMFAPSQRASVQRSSSDDGWLSSLVAPRTSSGVYVNEHVAMRVTAVYRSVALISEAKATLPVGVYRKEGERRIEEPDHPVARLLADPNPLMSAMDLNCSEQAHALQHGGGYLDIQRTEGGQPIALWPLLPDRTRPEPMATDSRRLVYTTHTDGRRLEMDPANVVHIRGLSFDGVRGYSPLALARNAVGLALGTEEFGGKFFANDARSGGFLEHPGKLNAEAKKNIRGSLEEQSGLENAHRIKILEEGMKYHAVTISPEDAQFLATRTFQVEEIARLYGVPLHMLQSQSKTTSWGTGISEMSMGFLIYTLMPWLIRWEQELDRKLFTPAERAAGYFTKHNVNALLRANAESRARFYTAALSRATGWMSRDEVRALEELNPDGIENTEPAAPGGFPAAAPDDVPAGPEDDNGG